MIATLPSANMKAELDAEHTKLKRTEELAGVGAASRQEFEAVQASHAIHQSHVRAAQQKLVLLGVSEEQIATLESSQQINSDVTVPAPIDGIVVTRMVNLEQVVSMRQPMFTVADLSTVWVIAGLFEKDFAAVRVGSRATISTPAYLDRCWLFAKRSGFTPSPHLCAADTEKRIRRENLLDEAGSFITQARALLYWILRMVISATGLRQSAAEGWRLAPP